MKRSNEKITDTIKSGKKPRRIRPRVIALSKVGMTEEEMDAYDREWGRDRIAALGYRTDQFGNWIGRGD